jgi:UDP-N-acetylmuramoyl-L-alanyl-D-glutamate--2,6-diaminopimelate ligase
VNAAHLGLLLQEIRLLNPRDEPAPRFADLAVTGVAYDHRRVAPGAVFVCLRGQKHDGHEFAVQAAAAGACLVVGESPHLAAPIDPVPYVRVDDARAALALLSCGFYGHPSRDLSLTGVTGTNGKTSFTYLLHAVHREAGISSAILGTLGSGTPPNGGMAPFKGTAEDGVTGAGTGTDAGTDATAGTDRFPHAAIASLPWRCGVHTTPESPDLQAELSRWHSGGVRAGVMEVSSHGLALRRSYGTRFACVVFTNLTADHLDFHGTMEAYREAKSLLFRRAERGPQEPPTVAVVNGDDAAAAAILRGSDDRVLRFGRSSKADVRLLAVEAGPAGIRMRVAFPGGECGIDSPLLGSFQVDNLLAAFAAAVALGIDPGGAARGLGRVRCIPGRMERVDCGQGFPVLVDYAHTPDALHRALEGLRPFTPGRVIVVFGCGGDRDRAKRPLMGEAAARGADLIFLTDDNPRRENPAAIRAAARAGLEAAGGVCREIGDRAEAIQAALEEARAGDTVLIAGKGHETIQVRGNESLPFDDREVAARLLVGRSRDTAGETS